MHLRVILLLKMKKQTPPSLAETICDLCLRKTHNLFLDQIEKLINWAEVSKLIAKHYKKGSRLLGKPAYDGLLLVKMCLFKTWYGLNDYEVEDRLNDSLSCSKVL